MPVLLSRRVDQTYRDAVSRFAITIAQQMWCLNASAGGRTVPKSALPFTTWATTQGSLIPP
jgi:hypothetical protein